MTSKADEAATESDHCLLNPTLCFRASRQFEAIQVKSLASAAVARRYTQSGLLTHSTDRSTCTAEFRLHARSFHLSAVMWGKRNETA